jgi:hypothetical protein
MSQRVEVQKWLSKQVGKNGRKLRTMMRVTMNIRPLPPDILDALFHAHLDARDQCRGRSFGLCAEGEQLMRLTSIDG